MARLGSESCIRRPTDSGPVGPNIDRFALQARFWTLADALKAAVSGVFVTNETTFSDFVLGNLNLSEPGPEQIFMWGGDEKAWEILASGFAPKLSAFSAQVASIEKKS